MEVSADWVRPAAVVGVLAVLLGLETLAPLRAVHLSRLRRAATNLGLGALAAIMSRFLFAPPVFAVALWAERERVGTLNLLAPEGLARAALALLLLDYTLYLWHALNHRLPFLWRFHQVHHADIEMDVTTASRFHFGELAISAAFRCGVVALLGIRVGELVAFELVVTAAAQFHHSNWRLPIALERRLSRLVMTPRLHGIHHSIVQGEANSNYSTVLSLWDRLHRTCQCEVRQRDLTLGVPWVRDARGGRFALLLVMPLLRPSQWRLPDGTTPGRAGAGVGVKGPLAE